MITTRRTRARLTAAAALTALGVGLLASAQPAVAATFVPITGAGSTWSYPAIHAWTDNVSRLGMAVNYVPNGSTAGRSEFRAGAADWAASEIPYGVRDGNSSDPPPHRGYAYMPDTAGGLAFMYNLAIKGRRVRNLRLSGAVIAGIFTNKITKWNDRRIAADNPGLHLPAIPITPVVRSDGSGGTAQFTEWMIATQKAYWIAYCRVTHRSPCTQTSVYPVQPGTAMISVPGDPGVATYVSQRSSDGAIGYTQYSWALRNGFPVAKLLNAAGYYTAPTPGNVAVSLLKARIDMSSRDPRYLTAGLSAVYTDRDPRAYELSSYSYLILPTTKQFGFSASKGYTLGAFGGYLLCQGQQLVDTLGYSALPAGLVKAGYTQLRKIPGSRVPAITTAFIRGCHNPAFSANGTNALANNDPMPPACDKQGRTQCTATGAETGGARREKVSAWSTHI